MEDGALRRRRMLSAALNGRSLRIFRQLRSGSDQSLFSSPYARTGEGPLLANEEAARRLIAAWQAASFWRVGRYVIMPDHIHLFCAPNTFPPQPLKNWISFWRNHVTRAWPQRDEAPIWQRDSWDRQLRCDESYAQKWEYVVNNPVRYGYVARAEDWPYQGQLNVLYWHD